MTACLQMMPWAQVYVRMMCRMPGGARCQSAVAKFVVDNGLLWVEG
jgi:hypothetical protein